MIDFAFLSDTFLRLSAALPVTLGLFISAFLCGALLAVPLGQVEAGMACRAGCGGGLSRRLLRYALLAYSTEAILLVKPTALASLVMVWDVTGVAQQII